MPAADPDPRFLALGALVDAVMQRLDDFERVIGDLATDVTTLAARQNEDDTDGRPWSWLLADDRRDPAAVLEDLIGWLTRVYLWYPETALPSCWLWHPWVIEELWCLRCMHAAAYSSGARSAAKAADWHERLRPGVTRRIRDAVGNCDLSEHRGQDYTPAWRPTVPLAVHGHALATAWVNDTIPVPTDAQLAHGARKAS